MQQPAHTPTPAARVRNLKQHLVPAFGKRRLDEIRAADVEVYKARKLKQGQSAKSVNNHLTVFASS